MKTAFVILTLVIAAVGFMVIKNSRMPDGLGVADGLLAPLPTSPNAVSSQTTASDKKVAPFPFKDDLPSTQAAILHSLQAYGGIDIVTQQGQYIHAVSTSPGLRFKDDLEFYLDPPARVVHYRSASRVGYSDMGLNRTRHARLLEIYLAEE